MLVDVLELNFKGERRPRLDVRAAPPIRAELVINRYYSWGNDERAPVYARLEPYGLLEELDKAKFAYMKGRHLVIRGDQRLEGRVYEQFWWCRFVLWLSTSG